MGKFRKWFRGAQDSNPDVEKEEVDLAQAIIDLHKVDPNTGEIVDITEDEDKAAEIRKVIGEISGKLEPEEIERLNQALAGLAYGKATGDNEPEKPAVDEEMKKAMGDCGLDAENEAIQNAFAEGVRYGEELEKNPAEREKLDAEHESEGMKKAMDECGLDSENPQETVAFAEGVKYGEKQEKAQDEEKAASDEDKDAAINKIIAELGLPEEKAKKLKDSLQDLAYGKPTGDEETAKDSALRRGKRLLARDAALEESKHPRDESGKFGKGGENSGAQEGKGGQFIEKTEPDTAQFQELVRKHSGNKYEAAKEFFDSNLKNKSQKVKIGDKEEDVAFTGGSWQELKRGLKNNPLKAELITHIPDILHSGKYQRSEKYKDRKDKAVFFHYFTKSVATSQGKKEAIVDVVEREANQPKMSVYSLTHEGGYGFEKKKDALNKDAACVSSGSSLIMASSVSDENKIAPQYEVVNIRFADEAVNDKSLPMRKTGGIMGKFRKWFRGAQDSNPDVEKEEVDLAQAIIDLHKVDPNTGEIVDITEDEDKAACDNSRPWLRNLQICLENRPS